MKLILVFEVIILTCGFKFINAHKNIRGIKTLCDKESELWLPSTGIESSVTLKLTTPSPDEDTTGPCHIRIVAPSEHMIYIRLLDDNIPKNDNSDAKDMMHYSACPIRVYITENLVTVAWSVDPCSSSPDLDSGALLGSDVRLEWQAPMHPPQRLNGSRLLITVLGHGSACRLTETQHTCIQIGRAVTLLCVARELLCDGVAHCPPSSFLNDENAHLCKDADVSPINLERFINEIRSNFVKPPGAENGRSAGSLLPAIVHGKDNKWSEAKKGLGASFTPFFSTNRGLNDKAKDETNTTTAPDNISSALAQYGPWGYLMLGMLICGTVLMFCGLWECCCRRVKPVVGPTATTGVDNPAVVVIGASQNDAETVTPPKYEDLDQPPKYDALFPDSKRETGTSSVIQP